MPNRSYHVFINEQKWQIKFCPVPSDLWGDCDYKKKEIRVSHRLYGQDRLDVLLHELIHARWPDLCEISVCEFASELAGILTREGFKEELDHLD